MLASNGSKLTFLPSAVLTNNASGVLTGGIWQASGSGSTLSLTGGPVTVDHATIILSGAGSVFRAGDGNTFTTLEQSLTTVAAGGALEVLAARPFTSTKTLADNGTIQLGGGTLTATGLSVGAGAQLTGFGVVTPSSKTIANAGSYRGQRRDAFNRERDQRSRSAASRCRCNPAVVRGRRYRRVGRQQRNGHSRRNVPP